MRGNFDGMNSSLSARDLPEETCSHCELPIACGAGHYTIDYDVRRIVGAKVVVEQARTLAIICAKCSLEFDLTRLDVPTPDGWYSYEPLGDGYADCCSLCERMFEDDEQFQGLLIAPTELKSEEEGPTVAISVCRQCSAQRALHLAVPPLNAAPPYCYQCGAYTGYKGGIFDRPELYVAHPSAWRDAPAAKTVRLCHACVIGDCEY